MRTDVNDAMEIFLLTHFQFKSGKLRKECGGNFATLDIVAPNRTNRLHRFPLELNMMHDGMNR